MHIQRVCNSKLVPVLRGGGSSASGGGGSAGGSGSAGAVGAAGGSGAQAGASSSASSGDPAPKGWGDTAKPHFIVRHPNPENMKDKPVGRVSANTPEDTERMRWTIQAECKLPGHVDCARPRVVWKKRSTRWCVAWLRKGQANPGWTRADHMKASNGPTREEVNAVTLWRAAGWVLEHDDFDGEEL